MKTKTKHIDFYQCETCKKEHLDEGDVRKCDVCGKDVCESCSCNVYELIKFNSDDTIYDYGIYNTCEECYKKIAGIVDALKQQLETKLRELTESTKNEQRTST